MSVNLKQPNRLLIIVCAIGLVLTSGYFISAQEDTRQEDTRPDRSTRQRQQNRQRQRDGGRRQFNPEQMIQRQTERAVENLNLSNEEAAVLTPMIKGILQHRMQQRQVLRPFTEALRTAVDGNDDTQVKSALQALKTEQSAQKTKADTLEKQLIELLTVRQEAQLTIAGIVNSDGGFSGFGRGRGGRDGRDGRGGRGGQRGPNARPNRPQ